MLSTMRSTNVPSFRRGLVKSFVGSHLTSRAECLPKLALTCELPLLHYSPSANSITWIVQPVLSKLENSYALEKVVVYEGGKEKRASTHGQQPHVERSRKVSKELPGK